MSVGSITWKEEEEEEDEKYSNRLPRLSSMTPLVSGLTDKTKKNSDNLREQVFLTDRQRFWPFLIAVRYVGHYAHPGEPRKNNR